MEREPVDWDEQGTPHSRRFHDRYRPDGQGLAQAREVFLAGCGLPAAWAGRDRWVVLETGFGLGLNFLACWQAWREDPRRPRVLHFVSTEAWPVDVPDLLRSAAAFPALAPLAEALAVPWAALEPGVQRLWFDEGRVLLTLAIGDAPAALKDLEGAVDSVFLDGFSPARNPDAWSRPVLRGIARHCRRGIRLATWTIAADVRHGLEEAGFRVQRGPGLPPKRDRLEAVFDPAWTPKHAPPARRPPGRCVVVGAGLAGAAVAASLARRGWYVDVLDAAPAPAMGASALPVGLLAPSVSTDDNLLSRLSRAGLRATWPQLQAWLVAGRDWAPSGVLERRFDPPATTLPQPDASAEDLQPAGLRAGTRALWHAQAGWVRPGALVRAWLATPGVHFVGSARVRRLSRSPDGAWCLHGDGDDVLARSEQVVLAAALGSAALAPSPLPLHAVRGQIAFGPAAAWGDALPGVPVNGHGHIVPRCPTDDGDTWLAGSTYGRGRTDTNLDAADVGTIRDRLGELLPHAQDPIARAFDDSRLGAWAGIRCVTRDRRPVVGELEPGLWISAAFGSRGLTFAALAGELLAAQLAAEPLPLPRRWVEALAPKRLDRPAPAPPLSTQNRNVPCFPK